MNTPPSGVLLMVEADEQIGNCLHQLLTDERAQYILHSTSSLDAALQWLQVHKADCVLIDEALIQPRALQMLHWVPLIVLATAEREERACEAVTSGEASDYLIIEHLTLARLCVTVERARSHLKLEQALTEREEHYRLAMQAIPALIYEWNKSTDRVERSAGLTEMTGYTQEEAEPTSAWWHSLVHPDDHALLSEKRTTLTSDPNILESSSTYRIRHKDGHYIEVLDRALLVRDESGDIVRVVGSSMDISARRQAEERFRLVTQAVHALIYDANVATGYVERSSALQRLTGYTLEESEPTNAWWRALVHPDDLERLTTERNRKLADPTVMEADWEYRIRHKNGHYIHVWDRNVYFRDPDGKLVRIVGASVDISERKQAEERVRLSEERYRALVQTTASKVWRASDEGVTVFSHDLSADRGSAVHEAHFTLAEWVDFVHPDDRESLREEGQAAARERRPLATDVRVDRGDGKLLYYHVRAVPLFNEDGTIREWIGMNIDVTSQRQAEDSLRLSEERYRLAADAVNAVIYDYDVATGHVERSSGLERVTGYRVEESEPRRDWWDKLIHPDDAEWVAAVRAALLLQADPERTHFMIEHRLRHKDGYYVWVWVRELFVRDEAGKIVRVVGSAIDITARKRAEEALRENQQFLQSIADTMPGMLYLYDLVEERNRFANIYTRKLLGLTPTQIQALASDFPMKFMHPDDAAILPVTNAELMALPDGAMRELEYRMMGKNGEWIWLRSHEAVYEREQDGSVRTVLGYAYDVTKRKKLEEAELDQRQFAEAMAASSLLINSTLELDSVLARIIGVVESVIPHDAASIMLLRDSHLRVVSLKGYDELGLSRLGQAMTRQRIRVGEHPDLTEMERTGLPLRAADLHLHSILKGRSRIGLRAYLGAPIFYGDTLLGFIHLHSGTASFFKSEHAERLKAFAALAGVAIHNAQSHDRLKELAAIQERQRLARDLHDSVSQLLFSASIMTESLFNATKHDPQVHGRLDRVWRLNRGALAEMRKLLVELRLGDLTQFNLSEMLWQIAHAAMGHSELDVTVEVEGDDLLPNDMRVVLYRVAQEAMNNVIKHARASHAHIRLQADAANALLEIADDGVGFEVDGVSWSSMGLRNMTERADSIEADLVIQSALGQGTRVQLVWQPQPVTS